MMSEMSENLPEYTCIEYPSLSLHSDATFYETLGGQQKLAEVLHNVTDYKAKRVLELKLRSNDLLSKPLYGTKESISALMINFKVKKKSRKVTSYTPIGYVAYEYTFNRLCDFQIVPHSKGNDVYNDIVPSNLDENWPCGPTVDLFLPSAFAKNEPCSNFYFSVDKDSDGLNFLESKRKKRYGVSTFITFEDEGVPTCPRKVTNEFTLPHIINQRDMDRLRNLFAERPIFSRSALHAISGVKLSAVKVLLPYLAYHFSTGPWRALWVRWGYDPRLHPDNKIYQTLDFRVDTRLTHVVELKRVPKTVIQKKKKKDDEKKINSRSKSQGDDNDTTQSYYSFVPGTVPPYRQFFYQYCDILVPEVRSLLDTVETNKTCDPLHGWFPPGTASTCRTIMNRYINEEVRRRKTVGDEVSSSSSLSLQQDDPDDDAVLMEVDFSEAPSSSSSPVSSDEEYIASDGDHF